MKVLVWMMVLALALAGCGEAEAPVMETVGDVYEVVRVEPENISVWVPDGAAAETMAEDGTRCYTWDGCELRIQTLDGGDIRSTLQTLTGRSAESLTVMEYERQGLQLYQSVWSMTGEEGVTLGRCLVADDGNYHYCVSLLSPETLDVSDTYAEICASFTLHAEDAVK